MTEAALPPALVQSAPAVTPVRRDLSFHLPAERIGDWHPAGRMVSHSLNALSLLFPDCERFFIHSVRHYRSAVTDPQLNQAITAFIGQEAMHAREHTECNELLDRAGLPGTALQQRVGRLLEWVKRTLPARIQLAITIGLEHVTAIMGDAALRDPRSLDGSEPAYARLWRWHSLEETEHKAVAFDVWRTAMAPTPLNYLIRCVALVLASAVFWSLVTLFHSRLVAADPQARAERGGFWRLVRFQWFTPGLLRVAVGPWFAYFRPGFHPWMHDNRSLLADVEALAEEVRTGDLRA
jgi:predicted metal-dependent hydrolase